MSDQIISTSLSQVGTVWVNCWLVRDLNVPFGGCKYSGIGREGLKDSLDFTLKSKLSVLNIEIILQKYLKINNQCHCR